MSIDKFFSPKQLEQIKKDTAILAASNTITYLNRVIHGLAAGQSEPGLIESLENAKDYFKMTCEALPIAIAHRLNTEPQD